MSDFIDRYNWDRLCLSLPRPQATPRPALPETPKPASVALKPRKWMLALSDEEVVRRRIRFSEDMRSDAGREDWDGYWEARSSWLDYVIETERRGLLPQGG